VNLSCIFEVYTNLTSFYIRIGLLTAPKPKGIGVLLTELPTGFLSVYRYFLMKSSRYRAIFLPVSTEVAWVGFQGLSLNNKRVISRCGSWGTLRNISETYRDTPILPTPTRCFGYGDLGIIHFSGKPAPFL
jgi:hypothetical protein